MQLGQRKALRLNAPQLDKLGEGYIGKTMDMPLPDIDSDHQTKVLKRMQLGRRKALKLNAPQLDKLGEGYIGKTMHMPLPDIDSDHQTKALKRMQLGRQKALRLNAPQLDKSGVFCLCDCPDFITQLSDGIKPS